jgi:XRE family transcriptional regulator, regulator of sulfur utilization
MGRRAVCCPWIGMELKMITRREVMVGLFGAAATLGVVAAAGAVAGARAGTLAQATPQPASQSAPQTTTADAKPILGPTVFKWDDMKVTKTSTGEVRSLVKQPTATVDELEMHITTLNPGVMSHPPHRHVNEELIIMDTGECETLSDGKWIKVGPGDVIFNASNSLHGFRNIGTTPATYHVINWSPNKDIAASK